MNERLDALLSARQDGALDAAEQAELERLLTTSEVARARAAAFERVDAALRGLAAQEVAPERLARSWDVIAERRAAAKVRPLAPWRRLLRGLPGSARAAALAAGLVVAVLFGLRSGPFADAPRSTARPPSKAVADPPDVGDAGGSIEDGAAGDVLAADALATLEVDALGLEQAGDVEVVAELELLEFLAARERDAQEPRG